MTDALRKIIALDIGNVCVSIHPERVIARMKLFPTPEILGVSAKLECGLISEREWLDFFHEKTQRRFSDDEMIDAWNLIIGETLPGMSEAVRAALRNGYSFVFLSDVSRFHLTECRRKCEFFHLALDGVYSFDVGAKDVSRIRTPPWKTLRVFRRPRRQCRSRARSRLERRAFPQCFRLHSAGMKRFCGGDFPGPVHAWRKKREAAPVRRASPQSVSSAEIRFRISQDPSL